MHLLNKICLNLLRVVTQSARGRGFASLSILERLLELGIQCDKQQINYWSYWLQHVSTSASILL